jgi:hypothetical protein
MINNLPFNSILGMLGTLLALFGIFMLLAGLKIINVQNVSVASGPRTISVGSLFIVLGIIMLYPEIIEQIKNRSSETPEPTAIAASLAAPKTPTEAPIVQPSLTHSQPSSMEPPTPTKPLIMDEVDVAQGKPTTASGYWQHPTIANYEFAPSAVVDRQKEETNCKSGDHTYWLLPDNEQGWVQVDLQQEYFITKIRWLNTHNSQCLDRATTSFHIEISTVRDFSEAVFVYAGQMEFKPEPLYGQYTLPSPLPARYVRFYVDSYFGEGGGLNELEIHAEVPLE